VALSGLLALLLTACDVSTNASVDVQLAEFSVTAPRTLPAGSGRIEIDNVGEFTHTLVVTDANGEVAAATGLIPSGETTYLDIDLEPGTYSFTCRIVAQDGEGNLIDHYEAGMNAAVEVAG
jgi:plastocyanin